MQGLVRALKNQAYSGRGSTLKHTKVLSFKSSQHPQGINDATVAQSNSLPEKGLHNTTVAQVLLTKGEEKVGSWLWCRTDDSVYDAVKQKKFLRDIPIHSKIYMQGIEDKKVIHLLAQGLIYPYEIFFASLDFWPEKPLHKLQMAQNNIGSLVVLKPGEQQLIAGIFTERDYLRKVIVHDRSSKYTKVGEIMTDQDKLISVSSATNVLHAMQLMTENQIRHAPVIDGKIVGMISIVNVVRAVLDQQHEEMKRQKWPYQRRLLLEHRFVHQA